MGKHPKIFNFVHFHTFFDFLLQNIMIHFFQEIHESLKHLKNENLMYWLLSRLFIPIGELNHNLNMILLTHADVPLYERIFPNH